MRTLAKILPLTLVLLAGHALAGQAVTLKPETTAEGAITLGDIFDGAGRAASVPVGATLGAGGSTVLSAAQVQRLAMQNGLSWANETGLRNIIIRSGLPAAAPAAAAGASANANANAQGEEVLTVAHSLETGDIVAAEDLTWTTMPKAPAGAAEDADDLIGKAAKHPIRSGAVASRRDVTSPTVIKRDDMITVSFTQGGVHLELQAKAKASAAIGEPVSVQNMSSGKVFQAVASGPGAAVVGPEANALRAAAITDPSRLALR